MTHQEAVTAGLFPHATVLLVVHCTCADGTSDGVSSGAGACLFPGDVLVEGRCAGGECEGGTVGRREAGILEAQEPVLSSPPAWGKSEHEG